MVPFVDHKNGITTDNSIKNLRWVTPQQNIMNRGIHSNNTSGYIGVYFHNKKWIAYITVNKRINLGSFATPDDASDVRNIYIADNNLEFFRNL